MINVCGVIFVENQQSLLVLNILVQLTLQWSKVSYLFQFWRFLSLFHSSEGAHLINGMEGQCPLLLGPMPIRMKRNHATRACTHCKRLHAKCSNERPCQRCTHSGLGDSCSDAPRKNRPYTSTSPSNSSSNLLEPCWLGRPKYVITAFDGKNPYTIECSRPDTPDYVHSVPTELKPTPQLFKTEKLTFDENGQLASPMKKEPCVAGFSPRMEELFGGIWEADLKHL